MPEEFKAGCQIPKKSKPKAVKPVEAEAPESVEKEVGAMIKVGQPAPEFTAPGFHNGKFANFSLSEYKGKWVLLCFYPGDFTFV